jgi:hypothetical protein
MMLQNKSDDHEAIRAVFDSNHDGKLDASDASFSQFKLEVVNADGSTTIKTLAQAGITSISLTPDATHIELPDGSTITGQTTYTTGSGGTGTVANTVLAADGLWSSEAIDLDNNGSKDLTTVHQIIIDSFGARTETFINKNSDDSRSVANDNFIVSARRVA